MKYVEYLKQAAKEWRKTFGPQPDDKDKQESAMYTIFTVPILGNLFTWLDSIDPRRLR